MAKKTVIRIATDEEVLRFARDHYSSLPTEKDIRAFLKERGLNLGRLTDMLLHLWTITPLQRKKTDKFEYNTLIYAEGKIRASGWTSDYIKGFEALVSMAEDYLRNNPPNPAALTYPEAYDKVRGILASKARDLKEKGELTLDYKIEKVEGKR